MFSSRFISSFDILFYLMNDSHVENFHIKVKLKGFRRIEFWTCALIHTFETNKNHGFIICLIRSYYTLNCFIFVFANGFILPTGVTAEIFT